MDFLKNFIFLWYNPPLKAARDIEVSEELLYDYGERRKEVN